MLITYVYQNCDVLDLYGQIPKSIYQASYIMPFIFLVNFMKNGCQFDKKYKFAT